MVGFMMEFWWFLKREYFLTQPVSYVSARMIREMFAMSKIAKMAGH